MTAPSFGADLAICRFCSRLIIPFEDPRSSGWQRFLPNARPSDGPDVCFGPQGHQPLIILSGFPPQDLDPWWPRG